LVAAGTPGRETQPTISGLEMAWVHFLVLSDFTPGRKPAWHCGLSFAKDGKLEAFPSTLQSSGNFAAIYYVDIKWS
jgi:hypothetical protein